MAKKIGIFLVLANIILAVYIFFLKPKMETDPRPWMAQIYPDRLIIFKPSHFDNLSCFQINKEFWGSSGVDKLEMDRRLAALDAENFWVTDDVLAVSLKRSDVVNLLEEELPNEGFGDFLTRTKCPYYGL